MFFVAVQNGRVSYFVPILESHESIGSDDRYREWLETSHTAQETKAFRVQKSLER